MGSRSCYKPAAGRAEGVAANIKQQGRSEQGRVAHTRERAQARKRTQRAAAAASSSPPPAARATPPLLLPALPAAAILPAWEQAPQGTVGCCYGKALCTARHAALHATLPPQASRTRLLLLPRGRRHLGQRLSCHLQQNPVHLQQRQQVSFGALACVERLRSPRHSRTPQPCSTSHAVGGPQVRLPQPSSWHSRRAGRQPEPWALPPPNPLSQLACSSVSSSKSSESMTPSMTSLIISSMIPALVISAPAARHAEQQRSGARLHGARQPTPAPPPDKTPPPDASRTCTRSSTTPLQEPRRPTSRHLHHRLLQLRHLHQVVHQLHHLPALGQRARHARHGWRRQRRGGQDEGEGNVKAATEGTRLTLVSCSITT